MLRLGVFGLVALLAVGSGCLKDAGAEDPIGSARLSGGADGVAACDDVANRTDLRVERHEGAADLTYGEQVALVSGSGGGTTSELSLTIPCGTASVSLEITWDAMTSYPSQAIVRLDECSNVTLRGPPPLAVIIGNASLSQGSTCDLWFEGEGAVPGVPARAWAFREIEWSAQVSYLRSAFRAG